MSQPEKNKLFQMFVAALLVLLTTIINFVITLANNSSSCFYCDASLVLASAMALIFIINAKMNGVLYALFSLPVFVYAYNISDFSSHPPVNETLYQSALWLLSGAFILLFFYRSDGKVIFYFFISLGILIFQVNKTESLADSFTSGRPLLIHPLFLFIILFSTLFFLRNKYRKITDSLSEKLVTLNRSISEVVRTSPFPIVEIKAINDEYGNMVNLHVEKVNNAFESAFKINNYEITSQDANFIFELVFQENIDLYKILYYEHKKSHEFQVKKFDKWYKIHSLHPNNETFYIILEDITKIKKKLAELEISKKRYKVLLEAIPDIFFVIDKDGTYEDFVIKESDLFKIEDANIVGSTIFDVGFPENMADKIYQCIQNCLKNNSIETIEYSLKTPNGTYLFEMRLAKLNARSVISIARDITRRKNAEFSLEKAKKKAEESDRLKSIFLTNLSHEIRTPLNIITNFTRMLTEGKLKSSEKAELADAITQNGTQLLNMINNTIHLSKIETETVEVSMKFCEVNSLIKGIYNHYRPLIPDSRPVKINMHLDVPNPAFGFVTDSQMLKEILEILVDNAVKYTLKGEIWISYEMERNEQVKFIISDTGIGIEKEETDNIFSRFYRVKNEINDMTSGSGIGLPIAKHFIKLLGGELIMDTRPGKGTTITFSLPFREGEGYLRVVS